MIDLDPMADSAIALMKEPHAVFLTSADHLRISSWNSLSTVTTLTLTGRFLTLRGEIFDFQDRHTPNTDRTIATSLISVGAGWLLDVRAVSNGAPLIGQVFVRVEVVRGRSGGVTPLKVLCQGCCNAVQALAWPGSPIVTTIERPGALRSITGTNPAAGAESSETVPTGARWRLLSYYIELITSAAAGSRRPMLIVDDGTNVEAYVPHEWNVGASSTARFTFAPGLRALSGIGTVPAPMMIPDVTVLLAGHRVRTDTLAFDAGDNYAAPQLLVEEWLEAAA